MTGLAIYVSVLGALLVCTTALCAWLAREVLHIRRDLRDLDDIVEQHGPPYRITPSGLPVRPAAPPDSEYWM